MCVFVKGGGHFECLRTQPDIFFDHCWVCRLMHLLRIEGECGIINEWGQC
jgi:hypothetical protein